MGKIVLANNVGFKIDELGKLSGGNFLGFRQGDLDGACGPHAAMTALVILGIVSWDEAKSAWIGTPDGRTKLGKALRDLPALVQDGTDCKQVIDILSGFEHHVHRRNAIKAKALNTEKELQNGTARKGRNLLDLVVSNLTLGLPSILWLDWPKGGGAHWSVAAGYETAEASDEVKHLLMIDPAVQISRIQLWNAVLGYRPIKSGPYPYRYCMANYGDQDENCQVSNAIMFETI